EEADGKGRSLVLEDLAADLSKPTNWTASGNYAGTPGVENQAFCEAASPNIVINEIAYRPNPAYDSKDWVELYNPTDQDIDLSGWELHDSENYYRIPDGTQIGAESFLIICQSVFDFLGKYSVNLPPSAQIVGGWTFGLSGDGEWVALLTNERCWVDGLKYNDSNPWPLEPDGLGPSLSLIDPSLDNSLAGSWQASIVGGAPLGTPGLPNGLPDPCLALGATERPYINEIAYHESENWLSGDWVELYHPGSSPLDVSGWMLVDEDSAFIFPTGTIIPAQGYLLLAENPTALQSLHPEIPAEAVILGPMGLKLENKGERLLLYSDQRCLIDSLRYNDKSPWPENELHDPIIGIYEPGADNAQGEYWAGVRDHGSPGRVNVWGCEAGDGKQEMRLWLMADGAGNEGAAIGTWSDQSAFGNDATQSDPTDQPSYHGNQLNSHGVLRFDGSNDWYKINGVAQTLATDATVFAAFVPRQDTDDGYYLSTHKGGSNRIKMGHRVNGELIYDDDAVSLTGGIFHDIPTITAFTIYEVETEIQGFYNGIPGNMWTWPTVADVDRASIGQEFDSQGHDHQTSNHWKGDLAELMVFEGIMGYAEMQKVHTYLNIKYGIGIHPQAHLYYPYLSHPHQLAGIGRDIRQCLYQTRSQSAGDILSVESLQELHHEDMLVWGHDGKSIAKADSNLEVPAGIEYRMQRVWRFAENQETDSVRISFDLQALEWSAIESRALVLLLDDDGDFTDAQVIDDP
ncbi:MAG: lamin tail domain-containing protein, partial [Bacteroidota bacterium]